jgi:hypothetical protein
MRKSKTSKRKLILSGLVLTCAMAGTVQAASLLASGPVYGGQNQHRVACTVVNLGTTSITFVTRELVGQFRSPLILDFDGCEATLAPGATCTFQANTDSQGTAPRQATSCRVVIVEAKTNVRGTTQALASLTSAPLSEADLR